MMRIILYACRRPDLGRVYLPAMKTNVLTQTFSFGLVLLVMLASCKKEDHSHHDEDHGHTSIPFLPQAVYVANEEDETVTVINPADNTVLGSIEVGDHNSGAMVVPHNVQTAPNGLSVWVTGTSHTNGGMEQVVVIDPVSGHTVARRIDVGVDQHLAHVVFDSTSSYAFVTATKADQVIQYNAKTYAEVKRYNLGAGHSPHGLRYARGFLYVANIDGKSMSVINVSNGQIQDVVLGGQAIQTAVTPDGKYAFASLYDTREVARYDLVSKAVTKIALPANSVGPLQLYPTPDSKLLLVCDQGVLGGNAASNKVFTIDIASSAVIDTTITGFAAHGVVVSNDGKTAFVTNSLSNTVSVIDILTGNITKNINVGRSPNGISYRFPGGGMP